MTYTWERLYLGGQWVQPSSTEQQRAINPATEELLGVVPQGQREDAHRAIEAARTAFDDGPWPRMPLRERVAVLRRMAEIMRRRRREFFDLDLAETGRASASVDV